MEGVFLSIRGDHLSIKSFDTEDPDDGYDNGGQVTGNSFLEPEPKTYHASVVLSALIGVKDLDQVL
jgi:hypothetical protein